MKAWKLQKFAGDVVYDLRNRNLLLPVIALLVAIVAVPILLKSNSDSGSTAVAGSGAVANEAGPGESAVVAYNPGIRNYKQRLKDLTAKDPFLSHVKTDQSSSSTSSSPSSSSSVPQSLGGSSTSSGTGVGGGTTGGGTSHSGGGGSSKPPKVTHHVTYFWWEADIQVGEAGTQLATMNSVKPFQFLPSQEAPVLTYIGTVGGGSQAVFLVSKDVTSIGGEGTCFPSVDSCQLLGLNAGKGADLIYGPDGKTYHVQVLRLRRVTSSKPPSF